MSIFLPDMRVNRIFDIDLASLSLQGIEGLVFDLDNTLTPWHEYSPDEQVIKWFAALHEAGFKSCILSNSGESKVTKINSWLKVPVIGNGAKPRKRGFLRAAEKLQLPPEKLAMVGDQLLTDVRGGNRCGFYTILTEPIAPSEFWWTKNISRRLEKIIRKRLGL